MRAVAVACGATLLVAGGCSFFVGTDVAGGPVDAGALERPDAASVDVVVPPAVDAGDKIAADAAIPGLIAHYAFDEPDGTVAHDSIGGHEGNLVLAPTRIEGVSGGALAFDGTNSVVVPSFDGPGFPLTGTLSLWVRNAWDTDYPNGANFFDVWSNSRSHLVVRQVDRYLQVIFQEESAPYRLQAYDQTPPVDRWFKVIVSWDTTIHKAVVLIDQSILPYAIDSDTWKPSGQVFSLGRDCKCAIDEVRLYDRAFSAGEISGLP